MELPTVVTIRYLKSVRTGLIAAVADELPGFMITGRTIAQIEAKLTDTVAEVLKEQFGNDFDVSPVEAAPEPDGFVQLSTVQDWLKLRVSAPELQAA